MPSVYDNLPYLEPTGEILCDNRHDWRKSKLKSRAISEAMPNLDKYWLARSSRMEDCGSMLSFAISKTGEKRLYRANFCRDRMCPSCQLRRSRIVFSQVQDVCYSIRKENPSYRYLLLTLTVPNVPYEALGGEITHMMQSYKRLMERAEVKRAVKGAFRTLEVTFNQETQTYHPHFHVLLCVPSNYFTKNYIKQERWLELWREATRNPNITQTDIRVIRPNAKRQKADIESAAAEVAKYATKPSDYLECLPNGDWIADKDRVSELARILKGRRLISFSGLMLEHLKKLGLEDVESDSVDLIHTDDNASDIEAVMIQVFRWNAGFKNYISY